MLIHPEIFLQSVKEKLNKELRLMRKSGTSHISVSSAEIADFLYDWGILDADNFEDLSTAGTER